MSIDLGNTPAGTPPTTEQQAQIRTAIGLGNTGILNVIDTATNGDAWRVGAPTIFLSAADGDSSPLDTGNYYGPGSTISISGIQIYDIANDQYLTVEGVTLQRAPDFNGYPAWTSNGQEVIPIYNQEYGTYNTNFGSQNALYYDGYPGLLILALPLISNPFPITFYDGFFNYTTPDQYETMIWDLLDTDFGNFTTDFQSAYNEVVSVYTQDSLVIPSYIGQIARYINVAGVYEYYISLTTEIPILWTPVGGDTLVVDGQDIEVSSNLTLQASDAGKYIRFSKLEDFSLYVGVEADNFPLHGVVTFFQKNIGKMTLFANTGNTVFNAFENGISTKGQYSALQLVKVGTRTWDVLGGVAL